MTTRYEKYKDITIRWRKENPEKYYQCNKPHIYKWVEENHERYNEIQRKSQAKYEAWKRISKIYRNILI
jgi:hypothetical protein